LLSAAALAEHLLETLVVQAVAVAIVLAAQRNFHKETMAEMA
jgi:hypothetical protein